MDIPFTVTVDGREYPCSRRVSGSGGSWTQDIYVPGFPQETDGRSYPSASDPQMEGMAAWIARQLIGRK